MILTRYRPALLALIGLPLIIILYWTQQPLILSSFGARILANQGTTLALAAMAQMAVVLTRGVDLSVGAMVGLSNAIAATYMGDSLTSATLTIIAVLLIGTAAGALNGVIVAVGRIQPIIVTLASLYIYGGLALLVLPEPGGSVPDWFATGLTDSTGPVPNGLIFLLAVIFLVWLPIMSSRLGRSIYAVGDNEGAAYVSGLNVVRAKIVAYAMSGLLAALAGLFLTAQTTSGDATIGSGYTLNSVAAVVFGGVPLMGGRGVVLGPVLAAYFLSIIVSVLFAAGISPFYQSVVQGGLLIIVLAAGSYRALSSPNWLQVLRA
ncbi:monosaccharide ABC transporter membrane protein, CUT2 family [Arboricoccus pini]|uniref:Monosaccharide ABC transporter membrane protein, CUT2 family n=1 Tax=Arboricoccus pini TaxID=1963835 RepID=A0A212S0H1_9PROT|nr:ABC transporter permease [Arboricoccus pini]SNB78637.1 monosaccharide ABC transporter membrane protein, CUT2 family [Arboricoccus pini]